ncbi:hypothetical protein EVAR_55867_1 [Eumeta japonica]|uniref:Uncharacterized protein n=1 Tax=Eumeta variegata TaxID=151549 RepID=A0A4C1Z6D6_EUMVA|nr:hypothetical protein EVAR_55867_1 [Eumeta japonica]
MAMRKCLGRSDASALAGLRMFGSTVLAKSPTVANSASPRKLAGSTGKILNPRRIETWSTNFRCCISSSEQLWRPTTYVRNIEDSSEKNYGMSVEIASNTIERRNAHVIASPQHSLRAAPMSRRNRPP